MPHFVEKQMPVNDSQWDFILIDDCKVPNAHEIKIQVTEKQQKR